MILELNKMVERIYVLFCIIGLCAILCQRLARYLGKLQNRGAFRLNPGIFCLLCGVLVLLSRVVDESQIDGQELRCILQAVVLIFSRTISRIPSRGLEIA